MLYGGPKSTIIFPTLDGVCLGLHPRVGFLNQVKMQYELHASLYASPQIRGADRNLNHLIFRLRIWPALSECRRMMSRSLVSLLATVAMGFISIASIWV